MAMTTNDEQITFWSSAAGDRWAAMQPHLDTQLAPLGLAALDALALVPGERVADIGCGGGQTTMQIAARVGRGRTVIGVDISRPLLAAARARAPELTFVEADAQTYDFGVGTHDAIFSRFGVMFVADPVAAFTNLGHALRPGGRLAFMCWRPAAENPVMTVALAAAVAAGVPAPPAPSDPRAPGAFAFADPTYVTGILEAAGFHHVDLRPHDVRVGGNDLAASLELALQVGPLSRLLRDQPQFRELATAAVREALARYLDGDVVLMPSATWIVTATR
ncbi:MAG: class I SAM-dependent methyltransferase [Proteobacteria bacterium]|nr:class I SAM-dependent methyltransferase [Pseudomonadota bacterium]